MSRGIRCRYFECPDAGEPVVVSAGARHTQLCRSHAKMVEEAQRHGYKLGLHGDADGAQLIEAIRLTPSFLAARGGSQLRRELESHQTPDHRIMAANLPEFGRLGAAKDEVQCSCGWAGFYDVFPLHHA